ncbi:MAG: hypothetical protein HRU20_23120 [Pseudomonadales bacterium]|nr:hypothetical protein [Pseudomonadales bacterium]
MKHLLGLSLMAATLPVLADDTSEHDHGTFSFYAPIHATNLKVDGIAGMPPIESSVDELYDAHTRYFTFGFKWQGEKWFHSIEIWEGQYEPLGPGQGGDLGRVEGKLYVDMRQRISEYRTGYNFLQSGALKLHVIGGIREYDQTVDAYTQFTSSPSSQALGDVRKQTLNSRWAEATLGLQADYQLGENISITALHIAGVIGGSSAQTDIKAQFTMDNGLFFDAGYRWHNFESDGLEITENGALIGLGYSF